MSSPIRSTHSRRAVLAASHAGTTLLAKESIKNSNDIETEIGAPVEKAQVIEKVETQKTTVAIGAAGLVGNLVAALYGHVVSAGGLGLRDSEVLDLRDSLALAVGSSGNRSQDSDDSGETHLEGLVLEGQYRNWKTVLLELFALSGGCGQECELLSDDERGF